MKSSRRRTSTGREDLLAVDHEPGTLELSRGAGRSGRKEERPELLVEPALPRAEDVEYADAGAPKFAA